MANTTVSVVRDFSTFAARINGQFSKLMQSANELYVVDLDKDVLWQLYLDSFPAGTNPIFRTRTEHDCGCCRQFIRGLGGVISITDGELRTIWQQIEHIDEPYATVAAALDAYVRSVPIRTIFRTKERKFGVPFNYELKDGVAVHRWHHLWADVTATRYFSKDCVRVTGEAINAYAVFKRGLEELLPESLLTVKELIKDNAIYRGQEFLRSVEEFISLQQRFLQSNHVNTRERFVWENVFNPVSRFRNTVIGTLVQDLSEGKELEDAVRSFESKTAPTNYKRPKSLITSRMIDDALKTVRELELEDALQRRFAKLSDVSVNNVLFVDNDVRQEMKDGLKSMLMSQVQTTPKLANQQEIGIEQFLADVLPNAISLKLLVTNAMQGNFMSVTAPAVANSGKLLRWNNDFAWSYDGNVTDSIKQRVKAAGGKVDALMRVSLAWFNTDDLDLHVIEPGGNEIYYGNRGEKPDGVLDVDMNVGHTLVRDPVENVHWDRVQNGTYTVFVFNYRQRESIDVGFVLEFEMAGKGITTFRHERPLADREQVNCFRILIDKQQFSSIEMLSKLKVGSISQTKWGVKTEQFAKVNTVILSPNYWDDNAVGNKHWFFILDQCVNSEPIRGLYNEFLSPSLEKHRKVFEILGDKMKCPVATEQMSGVGFSSTKPERVTLEVTTRDTRRMYDVVF